MKKCFAPFALMFGLRSFLGFFCVATSSPAFAQNVFEIQNINSSTISTIEDRRGVLFDEWVRDRLKASTPSGIERANHLSDVFLFSMVALPFVDSAVVVGLGQGRWMDALELSAVSAVAMGVNFGITELLKDEVGRPRPFMRNCPECGGDGFRSFPSGHTSAAFTGAGLTCLHHLRFKIYGNETLDATACIVGIAGATTTGLLRIAADKHYATDILAGAAIGAVSGAVLPWLYYELTGKTELRPRSSETRGYQHVFVPSLDPVRGVGAHYLARF